MKYLLNIISEGTVNQLRKYQQNMIVSVRAFSPMVRVVVDVPNGMYSEDVEMLVAEKAIDKAVQEFKEGLYDLTEVREDLEVPFGEGRDDAPIGTL